MIDLCDIIVSMFKRFGITVLTILSLLLVFPVFAFEKPQAPSAPSKPIAPEVPAPPERTGLYDVPERPGMKVFVFAHPPRPTPPPKPDSSPNPSSSPSSSVAEAVLNSLVCNLSDPDSASTVAPAGWKIPTGNWTYMLNLSSVPSTVGQNNLDTIVKAGFNQYTLASGNKVNFLRGANTTINRAKLDTKNIISWGRTSSGTLGVTYIWYYPSTGLAVEVDTIMNNRYKWSWSNSNVCADNTSYDAQNIMTHELGHWLGLNDEYDTSAFGNNTMYGYGAMQEVKKNTLTTGDISGIGAIYP